MSNKMGLHECRPKEKAVLQIQPTYALYSEWILLAEQENLLFEVLDLSVPPALYESGLFKVYADKYRTSGRVRSIHGAFIDVNPASSDREAAELSRRRCRESCEAALYVGAENVVFHSSCLSFVRGSYLDFWADRCAPFYEKLAEEYNLRIFIENSADVDPEPIRELMRRISDQRVGVCLDLGHANFSRTPLEEWFDALGAVTIMISDLRGFTAISERMDPSDLLVMLNHFLGEMTEIIQRRRGTIIEFMGDGVLAVFGAPVKSVSHASDAVAAALEMELAMDDINRWNEEKNYPALEMGIGLDTGESIVGIIGSEKRMKYGVTGNHVNICSRIESYTVGKQILISPSVREHIPQELEIASEIRVLPKGAEHELSLTHVTGIGAPYNLYFHTKEDTPEPIAEPIPVCFHKLEGKHTQEKTRYGGFISIGHDSAVLETSVTLNPYDNIVVKAGGRLFCKVANQKHGAYLLHFTSIPLGYKKWLHEFCPQIKEPR